LAAQAIRFDEIIGAQPSGRLTAYVRATALLPYHRCARCTPLRLYDGSKKGVRKGVDPRRQAQKTGAASRGAASPGWRNRLIRQEIIGHRMRRFGQQVAGRTAVLPGHRALALLDKQARQHGVGAFFHVNVQQLTDLLPNVRNMAQPGQFVALQRRTRGREKEFPRRLGFILRQGALQ
jgi:hypothetical protein